MISFVVPAYNEERCLGSTLAAIHAAARAAAPDYEIVVADDASSDATAAIASEAGARVVPVEHRQISRTRNSGAAAARGERLFFVDADTRIDAAVVRNALAALDAGAVGGGAMPVFDAGAPRWSRVLLAMVVGFMRPLRLAAGCFVFARRDAFVAAGGFDERHYAGEEWMLSWAMRRQGRFVIVPGEVVTSPRKFNSRSFGETLWIMVRLAFGGFRAARRRESTSFWYDGRR